MDAIKVVRLKDLKGYKTIKDASILKRLSAEYSVKYSDVNHVFVRDRSIHLVHPIMRYSHTDRSAFIEKLYPDKKIGTSFIGNRKDYIISLNAKYLNYLFERKLYNAICEYVYLTYSDLDYFIKLEFEGPRDIVFDYIFGKTGALKHPWFREQFTNNYDDLLIHTVMKMRRASFPKYDPNKSEILTFIMNAMKQIFITSFIDKVKRPTTSTKMMDEHTDYYEDMDFLPSEQYTHLHGFDILLELQSSNESL